MEQTVDISPREFFSSLETNKRAEYAPVSPVAIRGRRFLPGSEDPGLPEFLFGPSSKTDSVLMLTPSPVGLAAAEAMDFGIDDWASACRQVIDELLPEHGAILFSGIPGLSTPVDLTLFLRGTGYNLTEPGTQALNYVKAMRARSMVSTTLTDLVRTASDEPNEYTIEPHSEFHTVSLPHKLFLLGQECPSGPGGEWPVVSLRRVLSQLRPEVREKFERLGVTYRVFYENAERSLRNYTTWQKNIASTKEEVEDYLRVKGYQWEWRADDSLEYWKTFPAVVPHPKSGEMCWFNQIQAHHKTFYKAHPQFTDMSLDSDRWPVHVTYGDGTEIETEVLEHLRQLTYGNAVAVRPLPGSLLVVDNYLAMHGRFGFAPEDKRQVAVGLAYE